MSKFLPNFTLFNIKYLEQFWQLFIYLKSLHKPNKSMYHTVDFWMLSKICFILKTRLYLYQTHRTIFTNWQQFNTKQHAHAWLQKNIFPCYITFRLLSQCWRIICNIFSTSFKFVLDGGFSKAVWHQVKMLTDVNSVHCKWWKEMIIQSGKFIFLAPSFSLNLSHVLFYTHICL